ncbi:TAXI family TRAP transporter solute-binding subunit [Bacteroidota bacterium]
MTTPKPAPSPAPKPAGEPRPKAVTFGGSTTGATYTVMGAAMARMVQKYTGVTAGSEPLGGGAANLYAMHKKEIEFSSIVTTDAYDAPRGLGEYKETGPISISSLFAQHHFLMTGIVRAASDIKTVEDWRGKRLMAKNPKTALPFRFAEAILSAYGMTPNDVIVQPIPGSKDRIVAITEKTTDVLFSPYTEATSYLIELFQRVPSRFIPLDNDKMDIMIKNDPVWYKAVMPARSYKGQDIMVPLIGINILAVCRSDLSEDFVYEVMKAIWDHFDDELKPMHPNFKYFEKGSLLHRATAPFHPGAIRYWKEVGLWDDEAQKLQDELLKELKALGAKY